MTDDEVALLRSLRTLGAGLERSTVAYRAFATILRDVAKACGDARARVGVLSPPYDEDQLSAEGSRLALIVKPMSEPLERSARELEAAVGDVRSAMQLWNRAKTMNVAFADNHALVEQLRFASAAAGAARLSIAEMANGALNVSRALPQSASVLLRVGIAARRVVVSCEELSLIVAPRSSVIASDTRA